MTDHASSESTRVRDGSSAADVRFRITAGTCWVHFAFDIGHGISLDRAEGALVRANPMRESLSRERRTPQSLQFRPSPLRTFEPAERLAVGSRTTVPEVRCTLFDFGAVAVAYRIPLVDVDLGDLAKLANELYECEALLDDARGRAAGLIRALGSAVERPRLVDLVEDYVVFQADAWNGPVDAQSASTAILAHAPTLAAILRAADEPLSQDEIEDALSARLSYGRGDLSIVDWNAALVFDPRAEDILAVLEFANVELLEMRFLDDRLDAALDRSYQSLLRRTLLRADREERRRLATLQMDGALLFEGINNSIKLVGDQFLARLYRLAARRFHLQEWDESVMRKLETVQRLYEKLSDEQATRRMEVLEWIIIILIAISIVIPFLPGVGT